MEPWKLPWLGNQVIKYKSFPGMVMGMLLIEGTCHGMVMWRATDWGNMPWHGDGHATDWGNMPWHGDVACHWLREHALAWWCGVPLIEGTCHGMVMWRATDWGNMPWHGDVACHWLREHAMAWWCGMPLIEGTCPGMVMWHATDWGNMPWHGDVVCHWLREHALAWWWACHWGSVGFPDGHATDSGKPTDLENTLWQRDGASNYSENLQSYSIQF